MDSLHRRIPAAFLLAACLAGIFGSVAHAADDEPAVAEIPPGPALVTAVAEIPLPPLHTEIDRLIAAGWPDYETKAAPVATDAEFLRRVTLDLVGQLPAVEETRAFLADADPLKREKLVDRLLASPAYPRQMQRTVDVMLMRRLNQKHVPIAEWETFLRTSFAKNKPWDQLVAEILSADGTEPKHRGPARFFLDRDGDSNEITRDVARIFLGASLDCAQCHDHPTIDDFKQAHYYGVQAYLVRTSLFTDEKKVAMLAEKAEGETTFESVFEIRDKVSKGPKSAPPNLFSVASLNEPTFEKGQGYVVPPDEKKKTVRYIPKFSRRSHLADAITSVENRRFARTAVNRFWAVFLGRGIVNPPDLDHSGNRPSHPELLDEMTDAFLYHGCDVKWLIREIVLSKTYQRSSVRPLVEGEKPAPEDRFAQAILRPLSPAQFAWSMVQATGELDGHKTLSPPKLPEDQMFARVTGYESQFVNFFGGQPGKPIENLEATIDQALWLSNHTLLHSLLNIRKGALPGRLLDLPADNPAAIADELYLSTLIRPPTPQETQEVVDYLKDLTGDPRASAVKDLIWAVVMSSEFRVIH